MKNKSVFFLVFAILMGALLSITYASEQDNNWTFIGDEYYTKLNIKGDASILTKRLQDRDYEAVQDALVDSSVKAVTEQEMQKMQAEGQMLDNTLPNGKYLKSNWRELLPSLLESKAKVMALDNNKLREYSKNNNYKLDDLKINTESMDFTVQIETLQESKAIKLQKVSFNGNSVIIPKTPDDIPVEFSITPDGKRSLIASENGLWQLDGSTNRLVKLSDDAYNGKTITEIQKESLELYDANVVWWGENLCPSPDSSKLAYTSRKNDIKSGGALFVYDFAKKAERLVIESPGVCYMIYGWLDNERIICQKIQKDKTTQVVVSLDGKEMALTLKGEFPYIYSVQNGLLAYASTLFGEEIYIAKFEGRGTPTEIYKTKLSKEGGRLRVGINGFSPNSSYFACIYYAGDNRVVRVVNLKTGKEFTIDSLPKECDPSSYIVEFDWLDDNNLLTIIGQQKKTNTQESTWIYNVGGGFNE